jgi:hypothetical protein
LNYCLLLLLLLAAAAAAKQAESVDSPALNAAYLCSSVESHELTPSSAAPPTPAFFCLAAFFAIPPATRSPLPDMLACKTDTLHQSYPTNEQQGRCNSSSNGTPAAVLEGDGLLGLIRQN